MSIEKIISNIDELYDEMGEIPDNTADNKKRLDKIEKYLDSIRI